MMVPSASSAPVRSSKELIHPSVGAPRDFVAPAVISRSIISEVRPSALSAAAILMVFVVLPTPPFWLPTTITRVVRVSIRAPHGPLSHALCFFPGEERYRHLSAQMTRL